MKTDNLLRVKIGSGELDIYHKSMMGSVGDLLIIGNKHRVNVGKKYVRIDTLLNQSGTLEFIETIKRMSDKTDEEILRVEGKGRAKRTMACLPLLIYLAEKLDSDFHYMVIETFINDNILGFRDDGGNDFISLNVAIDKFEDRIGKNNRGCYISIAKKIRGKIFSIEEIEEFGNNANIWNSPVATSSRQLLRTKFESELLTLIRLGFVDSYEQLKDAITRL